MIPDSKEIGRRLYELRWDHRKTQKEMAEICGVSQAAYCKYESGEIVPTDLVKKKLADYYHRSVATIFFKV